MLQRARHIIFSVAVIIIAAGVLTVAYSATHSASAKDKDKDKTPPVISELRTESVTQVSAIVLWTTDEPADSAVIYGVDPKTNVKGPSDDTLVLSHTIALSDLAPSTTYAYCAQSADASNNKAEVCGTFTTLSPSTGGGGAGDTGKPHSLISGFAFPHAQVEAVLYRFPFEKKFESTTTAAADGSFSMSFDRFYSGVYQFTVAAKDDEGNASARKGYQFSYFSSGIALEKEDILIPPTLKVARDVISWGDQIAVSGKALPNTGVIVEANESSFETKSEADGSYQLLINSAQFPVGNVTLRARSVAVSQSGYDYSPLVQVTLASTRVPTADINKDGVVDIKDLSVYLVHPIDMNGDGVIDVTDISIFLRAFATPY